MKKGIFWCSLMRWCYAWIVPSYISIYKCLVYKDTFHGNTRGLQHCLSSTIWHSYMVTDKHFQRHFSPLLLRTCLTWQPWIYQLIFKFPFFPNEVKRASFRSLRWRYITHPWNINVSAGSGRWMEAHMPALIKRSLNPRPDLLPKEAWY